MIYFIVSVIAGFIAAVWACGFLFHMLPLPDRFAWWVLPWGYTVVLLVGGGILGASVKLGFYLEKRQ